MKIKWRNHLNKNIKRIVVKIGTLGVTSESGGVDHAKLSALVSDLAKLKSLGHEVVLVSSGAINAGKTFIKDEPASNHSVRYFQAASALGQPLLMQAYQKGLNEYDINCAQILLTHDDLRAKTRLLNVRNTILKLFESDIIPIINENDTVSFDEITVGDNDQLSAALAQALNADLLLLLSSTDGLFDRDPSDTEAVKFEFIDAGQDLRQIKTLTKTTVGRGGMKTKLYAVQKMAELGTPVIISSFQFDTPVLRALTDIKAGTIFSAKGNLNRNDKRAHYSTTAKSGAFIRVDQGAYTALTKNASLLAIGIKAVSGTFKRGDSVAVKCGNKIIAYGLSEYSSKELDKIIGKKTDEIKDILGHLPSKTVVHRNNLYLK